MGKGYKQVKSFGAVNRLINGSKTARALAAKYDPAIMDELLRDPIMLQSNPDIPTMDEKRLKLLKGMAVIEGVYSHFIEFRKKQSASGGVIETANSDIGKGG